MSPQHFKAFAKSLIETLTAYERTFGVLNIPEADIQPVFTSSQLEAKIQEGRDAKIAAIKAMTSSNETKPPSKRSRGARKAKGS
jgi:hypothetical protein